MKQTGIIIRQATTADIEAVSKLFAETRVFYQQEYELDKAIDFITERLQNNESVIFVAFEGNAYAGFIQLYPSFTSVGMKRIRILINVP